MKKNKIFITGARGFVGKNLVNYCRQHNFIVFNPSRKELDLNNYKKTSLYLKVHNPDFIVHLASRTIPRINSSVEYKKQFHDTINPTINIAMAASKKLKMLISLGSIEEYGQCKTPFLESMIPKPNSSYGLAKVQSFFYFKNICQNKKIRNIWLRPSLMFGKNMNSNRLIGSIIRSYKYSKITKILRPKSIRDYLYVDDLSKVILELIFNYKLFKDELFNISAENWIQNDKLINKIRQLFGQNKYIILPESNNHQQMDKFISSGSLFKATIPNFNFTKFNKALTETFISEKILLRDL